MDFAHLRRKGWTEGEITHVQRIAATHKDNTRHEQFSLWLMVFVLAYGSIGIAIFLLPLVILASTAVIIPVSFLLGLCVGFLLTRALGTLRVEQKHHLAAAATLVVFSFAIVWLVVYAFELRFLPTSQVSGVLVCAPYTLGLLIPYTFERRLHETA